MALRGKGFRNLVVRDPERLKQEAAAQRKKYHELKAAGICVRCWHTPAREGRTTCAACARRMRQWWETSSRPTEEFRRELNRPDPPPRPADTD